MSLCDLWYWRRRQLGTLLSCAKGASATEFAILVPVLGALLTGTIDLAQLGNQELIFDAAVRAGGAYAMGCTPSAYNCTTGIQNAVTNYAASLGTSVTVSFPNASSGTDPEFCAMDNATTTVVACSSTCSGAQCPLHGYVTIHAVWMLPAPLMPLGILPTSLSRTLTVRIL